VNLDEADGWIQLVSGCDTHREMRRGGQHGGGSCRGSRYAS